MRKHERFLQITSWIVFVAALISIARDGVISDVLWINILYLIILIGLAIAVFILSLIVINRWREPSLAATISILLAVLLIIAAADVFLFRDLFTSFVHSNFLGSSVGRVTI